VGFSRDIATETLATEGPARLEWVAAPGGGYSTRLSITSPRAVSLRVGLVARGLPAGSQLRFSGSGAPRRLVGPVTGAEAAEDSRANGVFWGPLTEGETQSVEVWIPAGSESWRVHLAAQNVAHLVASPANRFKLAGVGVSQACEQDVACLAAANPEVARTARSVAKLVYVENGITYMCTGTLISDGNLESQVPYLYTAAHCIGSQAAAATLNTFWFFDAAACGSGAPAEYRQLTGGATLLYANPLTDASLVRLSDRAPEGAWFSGWETTPVTSGTPLVALHHPAGDLKKITVGQALDPTVASTGASYVTAAWTLGSTEGGSSGSGIFTFGAGEYLLRGGLRGGSASCATTGRVDDPANRDFYSRIDLEAATLRQWLSAAPMPLDDYTGLWWSPDEPGWGVTLVQDLRNHLFAAWYTYDSTGQATWLVLPEGTWRTAVAFEGKLYRATGSPYDRPYDPARFSLATVGTGRIDFGHDDTAVLTVQIDGRTFVKAIRRQPI
jgi:hypothetical protein